MGGQRPGQAALYDEEITQMMHEVKDADVRRSLAYPLLPNG
jgi:hypothetical protein